ncbi:carcinine hydrolase/isopenicillin-N N-acyltransferase family protein [Chryseobacterium paridis]|uniref:AMP-activated protein kinase glycogen-binding domain-containing protein n=1 Tax=Chryseobacterium paridis TaxID=2800328 RepID=A0ABS1FV14_9FLAO|nr:carcinine hydrolase/isopenicillin-N N-acyltransferase family protein [Chryseobacterium paridis]MBK1896273.1 hypothetical protein [Chryseobacterium paridis]
MLPIKACTIFMANDGKNIWIGNNEDESPEMEYRLWYFPKENKSFGYMLWSEKHKEYQSLMWQYPQGGLNEYGLFMDYTAIDNIPVTIDPLKKTREEEVVNDILKSCKTVEEALNYINQFNLVKLSGAQLFIGDATGNYATVHGNYIVKKNERNFSLTNYCIANGHKESCWRRETAYSRLTTFKSYNKNNVSGILQEAAQKWPSDIVTNYSMAINIKKQEIILYYKNDFKTPRLISLSEELKKGKHAKDIDTYFPVGLSEFFKENYEQKGIKELVNIYNEIRKESPNLYNFNNNDDVLFGAHLLSENKVDDAIQFFSAVKKYDKTNDVINSWLGVAYKYNHDFTRSQSYFDEVITRNPDEYLPNLYYKRPDKKVIFKIKEWSGAQNVKLIGDFTEWLKEPIKMEKRQGYWYCEVVIPEGKHQYKFLVDDIYYLPDPFNLIYIWNGNNINSLLYL